MSRNQNPPEIRLATTIIAEIARPEEKAKVQAANDFIVFSSVTFGSFLSVHLLTLGGWALLNWLAPPFVIAALAVVFTMRGRIAATT